MTFNLNNKESNFDKPNNGKFIWHFVKVLDGDKFSLKFEGKLLNLLGRNLSFYDAYLLF